MPIWGQAELLCRSITEAARSQSEKLLDSARIQAENMIRDAAQQAERQYQEAWISAKSRVTAEAGHLVDTAELSARRSVMTFRTQLVQEIMEALTERLNQFRNRPDYEGFLIAAIQEAMDHLSGRDVDIEVNTADADIVHRHQETLEQTYSTVIHIRHSDAFSGGVRVFTSDHKMMFDNSLTARRIRMEDDMRQEIWRMLSGTQTGRK